MARFFNFFYLIILVILSLGRIKVAARDGISMKNQTASTYKTNISIIEAPILEVPSTVSKEHEKKIKITTVSLWCSSLVIIIRQCRQFKNNEKICKKEIKSNPPILDSYLKLTQKYRNETFSKPIKTVFSPLNKFLVVQVKVILT